jgi:outer membrane protein assembly factor BamB
MNVDELIRSIDPVRERLPVSIPGADTILDRDRSEPRLVRHLPQWHPNLRLAWLTMVVILIFGLVIGFKLASPPKRTSPHKQPVAWSERNIEAVPLSAQDILPTPNAIYWLDTQNEHLSYSTTATPVRYDVSSGQEVRGASIAGTFQAADLAVTDGWVWFVVAVENEIQVEQLDPLTLQVRSHSTLSIRDSLSPKPTALVTEAPNGPLWVAGGEDLWRIDPSDGVVETELDTRSEISSITTDPSGQLLYTSSLTDRVPMVVSEYDARTGREIRSADFPDAATAGTVSATNGAVWIAYYDNGSFAGHADELSALNLTKIAPPASEDSVFDSSTQGWNLGASVSDGALWVWSPQNELTCADPATGATRGHAPIDLGSVTFQDPIAGHGALYAILGTHVVAIAAPARCFG